jgi:alanyl-tRNA synthetase
MRDLRFAIGGAHTAHSPGSEESGDAVLVPAAGEEGNDSATTLAAKSFAFQFEQRAAQIKKLIEDINAYETELEDLSKGETAERRQKALILENKRIKLSKLKTLEVTEALKSADSKGLADELANRGRSQVVTYTSRFVSKLRCVPTVNLFCYDD